MSDEISLDQLTAKLLEIETGFRKKMAPALRNAASIIEFEAKRRLGHRQADWPALAASTVEDRIKKGYDPERTLVRTGGLRDSIGTKIDVEGLEAHIGSDLPAAEAHELGTERIPARPFLAPAAADTEQEIREVLLDAATRVIAGQRVVDGAFSSRSKRVYRTRDGKIALHNARVDALEKAQAANRARRAARKGGEA